MAGERILVADDSATVVAMMSALLASAGYEVATAADGMAAAEAVFAAPPDLVLLDVNMPRMNGYQVCRLIKSDRALRDLSVVLLTSRDQVSDKFWGAQSGADRYLTKDSSPDLILTGVREALAVRPPRPPAAAAPAGQTRPLDLLSRLNDLLDRRLFQATILNEVARVGRSLQDLEQCASAVMKTLSQLVDYHLAGVLLAGDEGGELYVCQAKPVTRACLDHFERDCLNALAARSQEPPERSRWRVSIFDEAGAGDPADDLEHLIVLPLEAENSPVGLLAFAGGQHMAVAREDHRLLSALADQVYIVLDNARLYRRVQVMAVHDDLTGLHNFRYLRERLAEEFARAGRYGSEMSLVLMDIDHFKAVNDRCGHQVGNLVLTQIVAVLRSQIRDLDVAARYGGEEFAVILPMTGVKGALEVGERLRRAVAGARFGTEEDPLQLTVSLGVASFPAMPVAAPDELITAADNALYVAKDDGRNCVRCAGDREYERTHSSADPTAV
jgi:two-component system cell cycle response regulator